MRLTKAQVAATKRIRGLKLKLPATRFIKDGTPDSIQNLRQYMHWLLGHLAESTVLRSAQFVDGGEILTALDQAYGCTDSCHCSACAEFKTRQSAIPRAPTERPQCIEQVKRLYVDLCGKFATASVYHNFRYYLHAVTEFGYMLVEGLAFKSQSLFCLGKIFNDLGHSPVSVVVDGAGELNSKHADLFYAHRHDPRI